MSSVDTDHVSLQDNLSPEILRRLQVEELWARRNVLADLMNTERMEIYVSRRSLHWPTRFAAMDMVWKDPRPGHRQHRADQEPQGLRVHRPKQGA